MNNLDIQPSPRQKEASYSELTHQATPDATQQAKGFLESNQYQ